MINKQILNKRACTGLLLNCFVFPGRYTAYSWYSNRVGNSRLRSENKNAGLPELWKKFWFWGMKRKAEIEGPDIPVPRSNQRNWNYKAEIAAFQIRLGIKCSEDLLNLAFCDAVSSSNENDENPINNNQLSWDGKQFADMFLSHYLNIVFIHLPDEAKNSIHGNLLSASNLAYLASNLGYQDFLQTMDYPPNEVALSKCFLAVLEVININEGPVSAARFILDFIVPCLNGKDIFDDIWKPRDPMLLLTEELKKQSRPLPEARLSRQSGINTVLPIFYVAVFSGKELLAESGGESLPLAEEDAAKQALKKLFNIHPSAAPLPMGISVDSEFLSKLFEPLKAFYKGNTDVADQVKPAALSS